MRNRLIELRAQAGLSQADLGSLLQVSRQTIIAIEKGRYDPALPLAFRIAKHFDLLIEDVFFPEDSTTQTSISDTRRHFQVGPA